MHQPVAKVNLMARLEVKSMESPKENQSIKKVRTTLKSVSKLVSKLILKLNPKLKVGPKLILKRTKKLKRKIGNGHHIHSGRNENENNYLKLVNTNAISVRARRLSSTRVISRDTSEKSMNVYGKYKNKRKKKSKVCMNIYVSCAAKGSKKDKSYGTIGAKITKILKRLSCF